MTYLREATQLAMAATSETRECAPPIRRSDFVAATANWVAS